jgi:pentatricopeptide repeat protein
LPGTAAVKACGNAGRWEQALQLVEDLRCGRVMDLNIKVAMKIWGIAGIAMYNQQVFMGIS